VQNRFVQAMQPGSCAPFRHGARQFSETQLIESPQHVAQASENPTAVVMHLAAQVMSGTE
jgi:hypothetical protein